MRKKKLLYTTVSSLIYQITSIICGFVLPRLILKTYNSDVNGLVNSITEFLKIIAVLDLGVGSVVCSSLYKPLADKNNNKISEIIVSANRYFNKISKILIIYIILLPFIFILIVNQEFSYIYICTLIISMGISTFSQYYFGIVNQLLLTADQKGYIQYNLQTVTLIINTIVCSVLIIYGVEIQIVKFVTSIIFITRPLYLNWYVKKHYFIDKKIKYNEDPIKQKWNAMGQHLTAVVLDSTDTIVLSTFSTLANVSIYSVYYLVIHGLRQLLQSLTNGVQSLFGNLIASNEEHELKETFKWTEWGIHTATTFIFGCTTVLIVPFVQIYTKEITDINYIAPLFGVLLSLAHASFCLRIPYHLLVKAAGHYKETQNNYWIAMILNIIISVVTVKYYGLVGVAVGTLISMLYQVIWMAYYCSRNIIYWPFKNFCKQMIVNILTIVCGILLTDYFVLQEVALLEFFVLCIKVVIVWILIMIIINYIFFKNIMLDLLKIIKLKFMNIIKVKKGKFYDGKKNNNSF